MNLRFSRVFFILINLVSQVYIWVMCWIFIKFLDFALIICNIGPDVLMLITLYCFIIYGIIVDDRRQSTFSNNARKWSTQSLYSQRAPTIYGSTKSLCIWNTRVKSSFFSSFFFFFILMLYAWLLDVSRNIFFCLQVTSSLEYFYGRGFWRSRLNFF